MSLSESIAMAQRLEAIKLRAQAIETKEGINILAIYCSATGKQLALLDESAMLCIDESFDDADLLLQAMLAARPSHGWIIKRKNAYKHFRQVDPNGLLTHLICLVFDAMESQKKKAFLIDGRAYATLHATTTAVSDYTRKKILLRKHIDSLSHATRDKMLAQTLELDARRGLESITPPHKMTLDLLLENFIPQIALLLQHCETELQLARKVESKSGNYLSRQFTGITADPARPKHTAFESHTKETRAARELADLFLSEIGVTNADDLRDLNATLVANPESIRAILKRGKEEAKASGIQYTNLRSRILSASQLSTAQRIEEYNKRNKTSSIVTAKGLKI